MRTDALTSLTPAEPEGTIMKSRILILGVALLLQFECAAVASSLSFDTSQSRFRQDANNQGWWGGALTRTADNDNPFTGRFVWGGGETIMHDYFTFDLRLLGTDVAATSALLELERGGFNSPGSVSFFDVSTDPAYLNTGTGIDLGVWDDLGTGLSYGTFAVPASGAPSDVLAFVLNENAIADINAARGSFFSVGGRLESEGYLFAGNAWGVHRLTLDVTPIPEPTSPSPLVIGGLSLLLRRRIA
jgi:hypothetical protein